MKSVGISLIWLLGLYSGYASANTEFEPHFFTTVGSMSWGNYHEGASSSLVETTLQRSGVPSSLAFSSGRESTLVGGIGMGLTERWSFEFMLNRLPQAKYSIGAPFSGGPSDIVVESDTKGWNAKLGAEYAIPLGRWGVKATARAGFSHSKITVVGTQRSTDPNSTVNPITDRTSTTWGDPFLGIGIRIPFLFGYDNWEVSTMVTRIFTDEESLNQSFSARLVYNFK